jgi:hypothetical protein
VTSDGNASERTIRRSVETRLDRLHSATGETDATSLDRESSLLGHSVGHAVGGESLGRSDAQPTNRW